MILNLKLVKVNYEYCDYLRQYDYRVSYNSGTKELRPFVGVLFKINEIEYFAPLSSPKLKHLKMKNTLDFFKLDNGKLGALNFNNMIPVKKSNYEVINFNSKEFQNYDEKYQELLKDQIIWLNEHYIQLKNKSSKLYKLYNQRRLNDKIMNRCCDFKLLEEKCDEYNIEKIK